MKGFKQIIGALSRDMLFLHGHIISIQGLDGGAQQPLYPSPKDNAESHHGEDRAKPSRGTCKACNA